MEPDLQLLNKLAREHYGQSNFYNLCRMRQETVRRLARKHMEKSVLKETKQGSTMIQ